MTSHNQVVKSVVKYFETLNLAGNVIEIEKEKGIQFGSRQGGFADVVLQSGRHSVAIAECKNLWDNVEAAKAQLKSYLCATGTPLGVLAISEDMNKWLFCENKGSYYFIVRTRAEFESKVAGWTSNKNVQKRGERADQWESTAQEIRKSLKNWRYIAGCLAIVVCALISALITSFAKPTPVPLSYDFTEMATIYGGAFQMGSNDIEADADEKPVHTVHLDTFYIDVHEVTNAQYKQFVDANPEWQKDRIPEKYHDGNYLKNWDGTDYPQGQEKHPVVYVSWYAAMAYSQWAGKRLPTEAEWEKAARGGLVSQAYPWGNFIDKSMANYSGDGTTPVGSYSPNAYGLYDVVGNAWEWCLDVYKADFYSVSPRRNPLAGASLTEILETSPTVKDHRVVRSGYWYNLPMYVRGADRYKLSPDSTHRGGGFRCVMKPKESQSQD